MPGSHVILVGALPPPVHGMAAVNAAIYEQFKNSGIDLSVIDISAANLYRSVVMRLARLPRVLQGFGRFLFSPRFRGDTLYMSVSGGFGQLYELGFLLVARARGMRIYLHYHSFAYLDRYMGLTNLLIKAGGPGCIHVTLSPAMAVLLQARYPAARHVISVSNTVFFADSCLLANVARTGLRTLGFLSNISAEKGIFDFLDLAEACAKEGLPLRGKIAGPFQDAETETRVRKRLEGSTTVDYVGPQYGEDKIRFLQSIDVLVFPTRYVNEAEPLTLHEAMQQHLPVIAYGRGAVPEIVDRECGLVIDPDSPFVPEALTLLRQWLAQPATYQQASQAARAQFVTTLNLNRHHWQNLVNGISDNSKE